MADTLVADTSVADTPAGDSPACDIAACDKTRLCGICQYPLVGVTPEPVESLLCGHLFHHYCIHKYAETMHCTLAQLACPMCRRVGSDIEASIGSINVGSQDDDRDPSAAGSNDPCPAGRWGKGTGKVRLLELLNGLPDDSVIVDAAASMAYDGVSADGMPAAVMLSDVMSADTRRRLMGRQHL